MVVKDRVSLQVAIISTLSLMIIAITIYTGLRNLVGLLAPDLVSQADLLLAFITSPVIWILYKPIISLWQQIFKED